MTDRYPLTGLIERWSDMKRASKELFCDDEFFRAMLDALPVAVYIADPDGRITYYNEAAATFWGCDPEPDMSGQWCGSWKLFWPDGRAMDHSECPMALAVKDRQPVRGVEAIAERPDGTCVPFMHYPSPLYDKSGEFAGAVSMLIDLTDR